MTDAELQLAADIEIRLKAIHTETAAIRADIRRRSIFWPVLGALIAWSILSAIVWYIAAGLVLAAILQGFRPPPATPGTTDTHTYPDRETFPSANGRTYNHDAIPRVPGGSSIDWIRYEADFKNDPEAAKAKYWK